MTSGSASAESSFASADTMTRSSPLEPTTTGLSASEAAGWVLDQVWALVADLRSHGIAHRDLRLANVFVAAGDDPHR